MNESPEIRIDNLREAQDMAPGSKPAYLAAIFRGTLTPWPDAKLRISGGSFLANEVERSLIRLGVPADRIEVSSISAAHLFNLPSSPSRGSMPLFNTGNSVAVTIVYRSAPAAKRAVSMKFTPDAGDPPVEVQFDVSPDGKEIEVGAQVTVLKNYIKKYAGVSASNPTGADRIRTIKIATKVIGLAQFDIGTQNELATTLKAKIKEAISVDIVKGMTVEFYGARFGKYDAGKSSAKVGTEFGLGLTITWD